MAFSLKSSTTIAAGLILALSAAARCESLVLETYYPSPAGIYTNITVISGAELGRDSGNVVLVSSANSGGSVGIGTGAPTAKLDVRGGINANGGVRFGNQVTVTACAAANEGTQRYNSTAKRMEFCDGAAWRSVSGAGTGINGFIKACTKTDCGDNGHPPCSCVEWTCTSSNPFTGACSCPDGTVDRLATTGVYNGLRHAAVHLCFSAP